MRISRCYLMEFQKLALVKLSLRLCKSTICSELVERADGRRVADVADVLMLDDLSIGHPPRAARPQASTVSQPATEPWV